MQDTYENGLGLVDWIILFILMVSWELAKELVKLMVVEKLREKMRCPCRKPEKMRKVVYAVAGSKVLHKRKTSYHLKNTKKEINQVRICADCAGEETVEEE